MSDGWRYFATRKHGDGTETPIAWDIPIDGGQPTESLSAASTIRGTISPEIAALKDDDGRPVFIPWQTAIYAEAAGQIRVGALVQNVKAAGPRLSLTCIGYKGYLDGRPYNGSLSKVQVDPLDMGRHIVDNVQSQRDADIGLLVDDTTSPVRVGTKKHDVSFKTGDGEKVDFTAGPYKLNWWSTLDVGGELDKLAADTPFDYLEDHSWHGDTIRHRLKIGYPTLGRRRHDLRFSAGENIFERPEVAFNGDDYASDVYVLGAGSGRDMVRGHARRDTDRLSRVVVINDKSITTHARANKTAERELKLRVGDPDITSFTVADHPNARLGSFRPGDDIFVDAGPSWIDARLWVRVLKIAYQPQQNNAVITVSRAERAAS